MHASFNLGKGKQKKLQYFSVRRILQTPLGDMDSGYIRMFCL